MFSDAEDETSRPKTESTLTMGDFQYQVPRSLSPSSSSPPSSSINNLPFSLKSLSLSGSSNNELVEFPNNGFDFYSSSFDNLYPYRGVILSNEQTFSCSTPTSNASFHTEMPFNNSSQPFLNNTPDSGVTQSDGCGLLTITSSPFHGNDHGHGHGQQQMSGIGGGDVGNFVGGGGGSSSSIGVSSFLTPHANTMAMNDSGLSPSPIGHVGQRWESPKTATSVSKNHFDFSLPFSEASISSSGSSNGSNSSASAGSPSRINNGSSGALQNPWDMVDMSTLDTEGPCASSMIAPLGDSIWSPTHGSIMTNRAGNAPDSGFPLLDDALTKLNKKQLLALVDLLKDKYDELLRTGETGGATHVQNAMVKVQEFIISSYVSEPTGNLCSVGTPKTTDGPPSLLPSPKENSLERVVKMHKEIAGSKDAPYTWSGQLPPRIHRNPVYSSKVFLGGLPWDITESTLMQAFKPFGITKIEWPGKDGYTGKPKGYAYAVFDSDKQVKMLLQNCTLDYSSSRSGNYYFKISSKKYRGKDVQIIPWAMSDSNFVRCQASKIDPLKTVFVGALHGMVNAEGLATIMNDLFDNVIYAGIDTDRTKYPIGSARVTFNSTRSYMKAVTAAFVLIKTSRFEKKLQVDPYLEDATCSVCNLQQGPYFCRDSACFSYFCRTCFQYKHAEGPFRAHRPMMRTTHNKQHMGFNGFHQQSYSTSGNNSFSGGNNGVVNNNGNGNMSGGGGHHQHFNSHQQNGNGGGGSSGSGGHNFHHQNGYAGNGHHYASNNNNRQWNNGNNNNGGGGIGLRTTHAMNQLNQLHNFMSSSGGGSGTKFINCGNSVGGSQGGGALNLGNNPAGGSILQGQLPGNSRNFGHRQPHYTRW